MRTTVDLPADLMRAAKAFAAARGESLKDFFARAVSHELDQPVERHGSGQVRLPLVGSSRRGEVDVTNEQIARALSDDDIEMYGTR